MATKLKENRCITEPCKRNFLKENMENVTKLKKEKENKENQSGKNRKGIKKLQTGAKPRFLWRKKDFNEVQCQCDPFYLADRDTQTYRLEDEEFLEGTKVIFPSTEILKTIRQERERKFQENLSDKLKEKRKFDNTDDEVYLDSLSEYIDTGAISRRKKLMAAELSEMDKKINDLEYDTKLILEFAIKRAKANKGEIKQVQFLDTSTSTDAIGEAKDVIDNKEAIMGKNIDNAIKQNVITDINTIYSNENIKDPNIEEAQTNLETNEKDIVVLFKRTPR